MIRKHVKSSNIQSAGYDPESGILEIEFKGGAVYQYFDVPERVYDAFMQASSAGSYFHRHIKNTYRWRKM